ncbi:MAG: ribonuclease I [Gammaproteobacteria bacterium]|nr:MAG: ribonuclease I [Gammaproteobacteria bacterium]UTW41947.1 ribonuclease I [bacterium SCSIO 12844]
MKCFKNYTSIIQIALISITFIPLNINASPLSGTFDVTAESCPAYVSKNKQTNPGDITISKGETYDITEGNTDENPSWYRLYIVNAPENTLRWVSQSCGIAHVDPTSSCVQQPGKADSYVLALSWQSGFCQTYGYKQGKPECLDFPKDNYNATHFSLHGLWPNQNACGTNYGFCNTKKESSFCDYNPLQLDNDTSTNLLRLMPSYAHGSCLERYEWNKHGSCQLLNQNDYYDQAIELIDEINNSKNLMLFIDSHIGKSMTISEFNNEFDQAFGKGASDKVYLGCQNNMLVDVYVNLPLLNGINLPHLAELLPLANHAKNDNCPETFMISDFHTS